MRRHEPRIVDPTTHPRRYVSLRVAAAYLEVDERTVRKYLDTGVLGFSTFGHRRRIEVSELAAFEARQRTPSVPRATA